MVKIIPLFFEDFKKLSIEDDRRVYYYMGDDTLELYFLAESFILKSIVAQNSIQNRELFFQDRLFARSLKIPYPLREKYFGAERPYKDTDITEVEFNRPLEEQEDIQKEGVELDGQG